MAKQVKITEQEKAPQGIVINQITVNKVVRQVLDIGKWRLAIQNADNDRMTLLYDLYEDIMLDGRLWDAIDRRVRAVTGADLQFQMADNSENQQMIDLIDTQEFEFMISEIMQSLFWGVTLVQLDFSNGLTCFSVPRKHIRPKSKTVAIMQNDIEGQIDYKSLANIIDVYNKKDPFGLIMRAAPYVIMMRGGVGDWAQMVELFGMPQRIGKYSIYDQEARKQLEEAFKSQGAAASMVVPKETDVETASNSSSVNSSIYKDFIAELKEALLVTVLSNTMTTLNGSSRSQSEVHQDVEDEVNRQDLRFVQRVLNKQLIPILEARGYKVNGGRFVFPKALTELTPDQLVSMSEIIDIPAYYIHERFGIPEPADGDVIAGKKPVTTPDKNPTADAQPPAQDPPPAPGKKPAAKLSDKQKNWIRQGIDFFADARTLRSRASLNLADKLPSSTDLGINIDNVFREALREIYDQYGADAATVDEINRKLFDIQNTALQYGVDQGFSVGSGRDLTAEFVLKYQPFIDEFKNNTAIFAAFKAHAETNDIVSLLLDDSGNLRTFDAFSKAASAHIAPDYNRNWLKTEYNQAVRSASTAADLKRYREMASVFPNLEYVKSRAAHKRPDHLEWVGTILPIDHPWWDAHMPPSEWGCECSVRNTDAAVTQIPTDGPVVDPLFVNNPEKTAQFINMDQHPYITSVTDADTSARIIAFALLAMEALNNSNENDA